MTTYNISPSDLTFNWDGCKRCFYLKIKHNISYKGIFPSIFSKMGDLTSLFYFGKPTTEVSPTLPAGSIIYREKWVKSMPIVFPDTPSQIVIKGRFDAIISFEDGSYGIIDYKTSDASEEKASFYSRQLSAYAYALENPAPNALSLSPITHLGLLIITPDRFESLSNGEKAFVTKTTWVDILRDDVTFLGLLHDIVSLLDLPSPPDPSDDCPLCNYRKNYSAAGILD